MGYKPGELSKTNFIKRKSGEEEILSVRSWLNLAKFRDSRSRCVFRVIRLVKKIFECDFFLEGLLKISNIFQSYFLLRCYHGAVEIVGRKEAHSGKSLGALLKI